MPLQYELQGDAGLIQLSFLLNTRLNIAFGAKYSLEELHLLETYQAVF